jgi:hypothetical protein
MELMCGHFYFEGESGEPVVESPGKSMIPPAGCLIAYNCYRKSIDMTSIAGEQHSWDKLS